MESRKEIEKAVKTAVQDYKELTKDLDVTVPTDEDLKAISETAEQDSKELAEEIETVEQKQEEIQHIIEQMCGKDNPDNGLIAALTAAILL